MKKEIKFSLVYRDMWQSSGKYQPRADQLARIAPVIVEMGCFARVETNGGAFEQVNLLYGENPNKAVRTFTKPLHEAGIQTHMLDRALNALRMFPVPASSAPTPITMALKWSSTAWVCCLTICGTPPTACTPPCSTAPTLLTTWAMWRTS